MLLAAIDAYSISLFVHIGAVVVGFGSTYALALTFPVAQRVGDQHLPFVHAFGLAVSRYFATPALVIVLLTGVYQTLESDGRGWSLGDPWISATFLIVIVLGGLVGGYFIPTDRRLGAMVERDLQGGGSPSDEYTRGAKQSGMVGALAGVLVLVAIFLMTTKPGA